MLALLEVLAQVFESLSSIKNLSWSQIVTLVGYGAAGAGTAIETAHKLTPSAPLDWPVIATAAVGVMVIHLHGLVQSAPAPAIAVQIKPKQPPPAAKRTDDEILGINSR